MTTFIQHVIDAASLGSLYALLALGIAVIFGVARIVNFAHGELIMVGGYLGLLFVDLPWPLVVVLILGGTVILALLMERVAFRPLRAADPTTLLVASFAVSIFLQNLVVLIVGSRPRTLDFGAALNSPLAIGSLQIPRLDVVVIATTVVLLVALSMFLKRTPTGVQLRAAAEDFEMARLLGVRSHRVVAIAFAISGIAAGTAAIFLIVQTGTLTPSLGLQPVLVGLVAVVVGGLGSLLGAAVGGFALGAWTVVLQVALPEPLRPYRDVFVFLTVILVLLGRPQGLIPSSSTAERV